MLSAVATGRVWIQTIGDLTTCAPVDMLTLGGQLAMAPDLLIMAKAVAFGHLWGLAVLCTAPFTSVIILAFWGKTTAPADLLVMASAIPPCKRQALAARRLAKPLFYDHYGLLFHLSPSLQKRR